MKFKTKLIIILILVIILFVTLYFARKVYIFDKYRLAQEEFSKVNNFYVRDSEENGLTDTFRCDNKALIINYSRYHNDTILYRDEKETTTYSTFDLGKMGIQKTAMVNPRTEGDDVLPCLIDDSFVLKDFNDAFKAAFKYKITNAKVDGFNCYEFNIDDHFKIYINKKDFFKVREENYSLTNTIVEYSIGNVNDEQVLKPSLEGYDVMKNDV